MGIGDESIFMRGLRLLSGSVFSYVESRDGCLIVRSPFDDEWYNFVVPLVEHRGLDTEVIEDIRKKGKEVGRKISYYVHSSLRGGYADWLLKNGYEQIGVEVYMVSPLPIDYSERTGELVEVDDSNLMEFLDMAKKCFPDWNNQEEFSKYFYDLKGEKDNLHYRSYLLRVNGAYVSFGSLIFSKWQKLAYLHNTGTLEKYRRNGYYSSITGYRCDVAISADSIEVFAIVDEDSASYWALKKRGFEPEEVFYLYFK